jgi:hypothetical protein
MLKMCILIWKVEEVSLQEIAHRLRKNKTTINCMPGGEGPCKKGSGGVRKMDNTRKTILKRQVLKYKIMTATEPQTSLATL